MHCPVCGCKFGFLRWLCIMNPAKVNCPSCGSVLGTGRSGIQPIADGLVLGLLIAGFASYMNTMNIWCPIESLIWFAITLPLFCGVYSWFIWREGYLSIARPAPDTNDRYRAAALFLAPAVLCIGLLVLFASSAGSLSISEFSSSGSPQRDMYLFFYVVSGVSLLQMLLLISPIRLSYSVRLSMLLGCIAVAIASFRFAPVLLAVWIFPAWQVYRLLGLAARRDA